jgi:2-amino-4-hydroxy-6-hydroxymethyldihydropteridine diphosphokinase
MPKAYLSLGSNLGNRKQNIEKTLLLLNQNQKITVLKTSSCYETQPEGYPDQGLFINLVVEVDTTLTPQRLLDYCNHLENLLGRKREIKWGPRTIDIDILLYENVTSQHKKLTLPHQRMTQRAFVMIPLDEIAPDIEINGNKASLFSACQATEKVKKLKTLEQK